MKPTIQNVKKILVIGAGPMGSQIGLTAALAGFGTAVTDIGPELLCRARAQLSAWLEESVHAGRLTTETAAAALDRMQWSTNLEAVASEADFVVEAATERLDVKRRIFERLGELAPAHAVLTTNSSTLGSSKVALASGRPDRVCNMHFFNPALVMKCVEVVRHDGTSQATIETTMELARRLGKAPVMINREVPGFVANRLMIALQREALELLNGGVASIEGIDATAKTALLHPMGPFELMDLVGLDVINYIAEATYQETKNPDDRPNAAISNLVKQGKLGRKSGQGWYPYSRFRAKDPT